MNISNIFFCPYVEEEQAERLLAQMEKSGTDSMLIIPNHGQPGTYRAVMLQREDTEYLQLMAGICEVRQEPPFTCLIVSGHRLRTFTSNLCRRVISANTVTTAGDGGDPAQEAVPPNVTRMKSPVERFLEEWPPARIETALNERVIGQRELTAAVADFLYYHALRQLHPQLPTRPMLAWGPSGCGKTEVWRSAGKLFGHIFPIKVVDSSSLSCEGWSGNFKIDTFLDTPMLRNGILVLDEFDKLVKPRYASGGENVSLNMQAELLKLVEGEYRVTENKRETGVTTRNMGFAMAGAFQGIGARRSDRQTGCSIGFCTDSSSATAAAQAEPELTDEDFIAYGIMPELIGRIAVKCQARELTDQAYLEIIRGPHSRVAALSQVLGKYGVDISRVVSDAEILEMVAASKNTRTGVRWVSAQVENRILAGIREWGVFHAPTVA